MKSSWNCILNYVKLRLNFRFLKGLSQLVLCVHCTYTQAYLLKCIHYFSAKHNSPKYLFFILYIFCELLDFLGDKYTFLNCTHWSLGVNIWTSLNLTLFFCFSSYLFTEKLFKIFWIFEYVYIFYLREHGFYNILNW